MSLSVRRTHLCVSVALVVGCIVVADVTATSQTALVPSISRITAAAWADPAGALPTKVKITNRHRSSTPQQTMRFFLSKDKRYSRSDDDLPGAVTVPRLRPGRHVTKHLQLRLPKGARLGRRWLLACVNGHCTASATRVHVTAIAKTSTALIDGARAAKQISAGTAVVYRVFAAVGDSRLPARYRGDDHPLVGDSATRDALAAWPSLSAKQRALIRPLLQGAAESPRLERSVAMQPTGTKGCQHLGPEGDHFAYVDAPGGHVRIWYPRSGLPRVTEAAPRIARQAAHIWDKLAALMGRTPVSDAAFCGRNGGNGRYDIYLFDGDNSEFSGRAITGPYIGYSLTKPAPAVTYFNCWSDDAPSGWELAHELFHAFQFAYAHAESIKNYDGFDEGSADWAANYVYPKADLEHTDDTLLRYPQYRTFPDNSYGYELWPFDLYLTERYGNGLMPKLYAAFGQAKELRAMNSVIPGGFRRGMREFARYGWNQTPVKDGFRTWDRFAAIPWKEYLQPVEPLNLRLGSLQERTLNLPDKLRPLARTYYPLHVADSAIRDLTFHNTVYGIPGASVQAFVKLADGTWHTQDWTGMETVDFCRDEGPSKNVTDLVVVYGNARYQDTQPLAVSKQPTMNIRNNCDHYYRITKVTGTYDESFSYIDRNHSYPCTDSGSQDYTVSRAPGHKGDPATDASWAPGKFGGIFPLMKVSGSESYEQPSCQGGDPFRQPCSATISADYDPFGTFGASSEGDTRVAVQLPILAHRGDFEGADQNCDSTFEYTPGNDTVDYLNASVPIAKLAGDALFTLTGRNKLTDNTGHTYSRTLSITFQPTDENGVPLQ